MLISHNRLTNAPILSLQTGAPLGRITAPIIDPRKFQVVAYYCEGPRIQETVVLHVGDIREVSNVGLIVDGSDALMPPEGLVRLQEVIKLDFDLMGLPVVTTQKKRLGKVQGYSLDIESFYIIKINVQQPLMRSFTGGSLLIDRQQIVKVTNGQITVESNVAKEETESHVANKHLNPILDNPFRHRETPQPNTAKSDN